MSDVYIWETRGLFSIVFAFIVLLLFLPLLLLLYCLCVVRINNWKRLTLDWNKSEEKLHSHLKFQPFGINTCANTISRHCFICRNRSAFSSSYQKRCYAIPIGHHKVMIKHFSKFIVESRASFLNEFLTRYHEQANKTREEKNGEKWTGSGDVMVCVLGSVSPAKLETHFRLHLCHFDNQCVPKCFSHTHLLKLSLVNSFYLYILFVLIFAKVLAPLFHFHRTSLSLISFQLLNASICVFRTHITEHVSEKCFDAILSSHSQLWLFANTYKNFNAMTDCARPYNVHNLYVNDIAWKWFFIYEIGPLNRS